MAERVARQYQHALRDLTFNSKPIINNLTMLAQENTTHAPSITQVLLTHLTTVPPGLKLPALYLIDSICKNIGEPFVGLFSSELMSAYSRAFQSLHDPNLEYEFVRVMKTWRGVFPEPLVRELEKRHAAAPSSSSSSSRKAPSASKRSRPAELVLSSSVITALTELRSAVSQPAHLYEATRVASLFAHVQINSMTGASLAVIPLAAWMFSSQTNLFLSIFSIDTNLSLLTLMQLGNSDIDQELLRELDTKARIPDKKLLIDAINRELWNHEQRSGRSRQVDTILASSLVPPSTGNSASSISFLDPNLLAALSPALSMLSTTATTTTTVSSTASTSAVTINPTNEDISTSRPSLYRKLYDEMPLQCKTCGLRYQDTPEGRERMAEHLDMHFKKNMRLKDISKRIMVRDWFAPESEWIIGTEKVLEDSKQVSVFDAAKESESEETEKLLNLPVGTDHTAKTCATCHEQMELFWDDDENEWMLRNAVLVDGQIIHANCKDK